MNCRHIPLPVHMFKGYHRFPGVLCQHKSPMALSIQLAPVFQEFFLRFWGLALRVRHFYMAFGNLYGLNKIWI